MKGEEMNKANARELAVIKLYAESLGGGGAVKEVSEMLGEANFDPADNRDISTAKTLVAGVIINMREIDRRIETKLKNWTFSRVDMVDLAIMRLCVFEMNNNELPFAIAINEAVELAKKYGGDKSHLFINGILGSVADQIESGELITYDEPIVQDGAIDEDSGDIATCSELAIDTQNQVNEVSGDNIGEIAAVVEPNEANEQAVEMVMEEASEAITVVGNIEATQASDDVIEQDNEVLG